MSYAFNNPCLEKGVWEDATFLPRVRSGNVSNGHFRPAKKSLFFYLLSSCGDCLLNWQPFAQTHHHNQPAEGGEGGQSEMVKGQGPQARLPVFIQPGGTTRKDFSFTHLQNRTTAASKELK